MWPGAGVDACCRRGTKLEMCFASQHSHDPVLGVQNMSRIQSTNEVGLPRAVAIRLERRRRTNAVTGVRLGGLGVGGH